MPLLEQLLGRPGEQIVRSITSASRAFLNTLYPKEFEVYMVSLELTDANDEIEDFFTFPINPTAITKTEPTTKTIERSFGKIVVNKSDMFTPQDIVLKGNFGRDFKVLIRNTEVAFTSLLKLPTMEEFNHNIKSGYGSLKVLQDICNRSNEVRGGKPMKLYFHNFPLGESYLVEVIDFSPDMNMSSNMMWNYTLRLKVITPINLTLKQRMNITSTGEVQKTMNTAVREAKSMISQVL